MRQKVLVAAFVLAGTVLSGCAGGYGNGYYVRYGPPAPRYGVIGHAPGPGYVWADGYWDWRGRDWRWVSGSWVRRPRPRAEWVAPSWRQEGRGWRFRRGYWR